MLTNEPQRRRRVQTNKGSFDHISKQRTRLLPVADLERKIMPAQTPHVGRSSFTAQLCNGLSYKTNVKENKMGFY